MTESTETIHLGLPKNQHSIKVSGTPTKGLDNCQLCDTPFDQDANKGQICANFVCYNFYVPKFEYSNFLEA